MQSRTDAVLALWHEGRFLELASRGREDGTDELPPEFHTLIALALVHTGATGRALEVVRALNLPRASAIVRARCEMVLGLLGRFAGHLTDAAQHFQYAVRLASENGCLVEAAWAQVLYFRNLSDTESTESVHGALADARRLVVQAADPHASAYLRESVARMEGQLGRSHEARHHLAVASGILARHPNAWVEEAVAINRFCLALLEANYHEASNWIEEARVLHVLTGSALCKVALEGNEGYVLLHAGKFRQARAKLERLQFAGVSQRAALETLARVHLVTNNLEDCRRVLDELDLLDRSAPRMGAYVQRWGSVTKARLLLRTADPPAACDAIRQYLAAAAAMNDAHIACSLAMLHSEALARAGDVIGAAKSLVALATGEEAKLRDQRGHYHRAWAVVLEAARDPLAARVGDRALRLWSVTGDQCALAQAAQETHLGNVPLAERPDATIGHVSQLSRWTQARFVANSIASAIEYCDDPVVFGYELLDLLDDVECASRAELLDVSRKSPRVLASIGNGELDPVETYEIGLSAERQIVLRCVAREGASAHMLIGSISTICRGIQSIAKARLEERDHSALWPEEIAEHVEGALFVAENMLTLLATSRRVAGSNITVLITGETGTGKEVLARVVHAASPRAGATFLPFNCAACPKDMVDAQLFGHRRGAFTGAVEHASGVIRGAAGGTLFFDEIGEAPLEVQPKLLRFLESGEIHPIGEPHPIHVDVRVIAATNANLDGLVATGRFRDDLFYRLNIVRLHLPPLRERRVEIPVFAQHYLTRYARELDKGNLRLAEETVEYLLLYRWPGNVRQLANEMRRMVALAERDAVLMPEHLSSDIVASRRTVPASERMLDPTEVVVRLDQPMTAATEHLERAMLTYALKASGGHMEAAAKRLGLSRKGLYLKRQRFGLEPSATSLRPA